MNKCVPTVVVLALCDVLILHICVFKEVLLHVMHLPGSDNADYKCNTPVFVLSLANSNRISDFCGEISFTGF